MTFLDVLLLLLPFSGTREGEVVFSIRELEPSSWIITIAFFVLIFICIYKFILSRKDTWRFRSFELLSQADNQQDFISKIDDDYFDDQNLQNAWQNFKKNLIKDTNNQQCRIYDSNCFFNQNNLLKVIGKPALSQTPSLLLSIGLLGTFFGLFYGLVQLNLDDADTLKQSMNVLIHASGAKFASSIWGLLLSILFGSYDTRLNNKANQHILQLQNTINELFPLVISEQNLINIENLNKENIEQNQEHFSQNENLLNTIQSTNQEGFDKLAKILVVTYKKDHELQQEILEMLTNTNQQLADIQTTSQHKLDKLSTLDQSAQELIDLNREILSTNQANNAVGEQQLDELSTLNQSVQNVINKMDVITEKIQSYYDKILKISDDILTNNREQLEAFKEQIEVLNGLALDIAEELPNLMSNAVSKSMDILVQNIGGSKDNTLHQAITSGTGANFSTELEKVLGEFLENIKNKTGADAEKIGKIVGDISTSTNDLAQNISEFQSKLTILLEAIQDKINAQADENKQAGEKINQSAKEAGEKIKEALTPIQTTLNEFNQLMGNAKTHLQVLPDYLSKFSTATGSLKDSAEKTLEASHQLQHTNSELKETSQQFNTAVISLSENLTDIGNKLQDIPNKLNHILQIIKAISDNAENTYGQLASQHQDLLQNNNDLMEKWRTELTGYQADTNEFTKEILKEMKDSVDKILKEMQNDLEQYKNTSNEHTKNNNQLHQQMIEEFIEKANSLIQKTFAEFDGSLEKFAQSLTAAISELNDAVDVLNEKLKGR